MSDAILVWLFGGWSFGGRDKNPETHSPPDVGTETPSAAPATPFRSSPTSVGDVHDTDLLARIQTGDRRAFAALYDTLFDDLLAFAFRYVRDLAAAEDLVHDLFLSLWSRRATLQVHTTLRAYLFGAVARSARRAATHMRKDEAFMSPLSDQDMDATAVESTHTVSPHDRIESADLDAVVMAALEDLPERQRLAITLRLVNDLTYDEIAAVLGVTKGAIAQLIQKAQARLQIALGPYLR